MSKYRSHSYISFKAFQTYGYFLGGLVPVLIFILLEMAGLEQNLLDGIKTNPFFVLTILGVFLAIAATFFEERHESRGIFRFFFLTQAIFSFFLIHLLVLYTGGPRSSVFGLSYLYLPSVVGYAYGAERELKGAVALLSISYFLNLFFLEIQQSFFNNHSLLKHFLINENHSIGIIENSANKWIYLIVFFIQIISTMIIAARRSVTDPGKKGTVEKY